MKYKRIYDTMDKHEVKVCNDLSGWRKTSPDFLDRKRPLWVVAEAERIGLRLWITHEYGKLVVTTADMTLPCDSRAYHDSSRKYHFQNQGEMAVFLERLFNSAAPESAA